MPANLATPLAFDASIVATLACPACHRAYPIVDGIPALIVERAEAASSKND
jgi:uncharacterized protein YbaR (Trm112 family)